jgi:hypothetical protein
MMILKFEINKTGILIHLSVMDDVVPARSLFKRHALNV